MRWSSRERGSAGPWGKACPDTPAWCGAHRFPQPHARAAGASQARRCMRTHEQCHSVGPGPGPDSHGVRSCWQSGWGLPAAVQDGDAELPAPWAGSGVPRAAQHHGPREAACHSPRHSLFFLPVTSAFLHVLWCWDGVTPLLCSFPTSTTVGATLLCPHQTAHRSMHLHVQPQNS